MRWKNPIWVDETRILQRKISGAHEMIGESEVMQEVKQLINKVAVN